jgi:hypothetical protein
LSQRGTSSAIEAVQITRVSPIEIKADPSAVRTNPGSIVIGRGSASARSLLRAAIGGQSLKPHGVACEDRPPRSPPAAPGRRRAAQGRLTWRT